MTGLQSFCKFFASFCMAKLSTGSIRVKLIVEIFAVAHQVMMVWLNTFYHDNTLDLLIYN